MPPVNARSTKGLTLKVVKGSFWNLLGQTIPLIATFIATPFVIRFLGSESYGVLILISIVSGYFSFADLGMGLASTKFGSEAYGKGLYEKEGQVVRTAALIAFFSSLTVAVPMFIFSEFIIGDILHVPLHLRREASIGLRITSVAFVFGILSGVFNTPQLSRLRMDLNTFINAGGKILMIFSTPIVLYYGGGLIGATFVAFCAALLICIMHLLISAQLLPNLFGRTISKDFFKPLTRFGISVVLFAIGLAFLSNLEKLLLTKLVSVESLAYYSIAFTFASMTNIFSLAMVQSLIPAFSQLLVPERSLELNSLFSRTLRISIVALLPSIMLLFVIARPFFTIWAGEEFGNESIYPYYILLIGVFFCLLVFIPNSIIVSFGRPDLIAKVYWIEIIPYSFITYLLIREFGILGAAMTWSLKEIINAILFIRITKRVSKISFSILAQILKLLPGFLILTPPMLFAVLYDNFSLWLFLLVPLSISIYFLLVWEKHISLEERKWIRTKVFQFFR